MMPPGRTTGSENRQLGRVSCEVERRCGEATTAQGQVLPEKWTDGGELKLQTLPLSFANMDICVVYVSEMTHTVLLSQIQAPQCGPGSM
jgi:hypothetical protein